MKMLDLEKIRAKWLSTCPSCDAGLSMSCTCPDGDPRNIISTLVDHLEGLYTNYELLSCSTMGEAFDRMEQILVELAIARREAEQAQAEAYERLAVAAQTWPFGKDGHLWQTHERLDFARWLRKRAKDATTAPKATVDPDQPNDYDPVTGQLVQVVYPAVAGPQADDERSMWDQAALDLLDRAWGIIASAENFKHTLKCHASHCVEGDHVFDLDNPVPVGSQEWRDAARRWRDNWHAFTDRDADELDAHIAEQMTDPAFAAAYRARQTAGAGDGEHPETHCHRCGGPNVPWAAPSPLWNEVMRGGDINATDTEKHHGIVCPTCFAVLAQEAGIADRWRLFAQRVHVPLQTVTPSGRTWNEQTWMWEGPTPRTVQRHGYTGHGHACCGRLNVSDRPRTIARCGGPALCLKCGSEAAQIHTAGADADSGETDPCEDVCHPAHGACCGGKRLRKLT